MFLVRRSALGGRARPVSAGRHEHGSTTLGVAVDGQSLVIELDGPAANFLGFEHKPATRQRPGNWPGVLNVLRDGAALFADAPGAQCRLQSAAEVPPDYQTDGHADLEAFWEFRCAARRRWPGSRPGSSRPFPAPDGSRRAW